MTNWLSISPSWLLEAFSAVVVELNSMLKFSLIKSSHRLALFWKTAFNIPLALDFNLMLCSRPTKIATNGKNICDTTWCTISNNGLYSFKWLVKGEKKKRMSLTKLTYSLMQRWAWVWIFFCAIRRRVTRGNATHCHFRMSFGLRPLHTHKLHIIVFIKTKGHPLGHFGCHAHLQRVVGIQATTSLTRIS